MSADSAKLKKKIKHLRALIDHPRTPEGERAAARHMLKGIMAKMPAEAKEKEGGWTDNRLYGSKYDHTGKLRTVDIAKLIREEIKLARKLGKELAEPGALKIADPIGDAPAEIKFSVRSDSFAGGSSIDITIKNIPEDWWTEEERYGHMQKVATPRLKALAEALKAIHRSYNHDGSDIAIDYFDVRFYGSVMAEGGLILA